MNTRTILPAVKTTSNRKPFLVALSIALLLVAGSILLMSSDDMIGHEIFIEVKGEAARAEE